MAGFSKFQNKGKGAEQQQENAAGTAPPNSDVAAAPAVDGEGQTQQHHTNDLNRHEDENRFDNHDDDEEEFGHDDSFGAGEGSFDAEDYNWDADADTGDDRSASTAGAFSLLGPTNTEKEKNTQDSVSSNNTTQTCNTTKKPGSLMGLFRSKKAVAGPDGTTDETKQASTMMVIDATTTTTTITEREKQPASDSNHNGMSLSTSAEAGRSSELRGSTNEVGTEGVVHDQGLSMEVDTGNQQDLSRTDPMETEQRLATKEDKMSKPGEESKQHEDSSVSATSVPKTTPPSFLASKETNPNYNLGTLAEAARLATERGLESQGALTVQNPNGARASTNGTIAAGNTFGTVSSDIDRILPEPSRPGAEQQRIVVPAVEDNSSQSQKIGVNKENPPRASAPSILRKSVPTTQQPSLANQGRGLLKPGANHSFAGRSMQLPLARTNAASIQNTKAASLAQASTSNVRNSSSLLSNNPRFQGLARTGQMTTNAKPSSLLAACRASANTKTANPRAASTSFLPQTDNMFDQNGHGSTNSNNAKPSSLLAASRASKSNGFGQTGLGHANGNNSQITANTKTSSLLAASRASNTNGFGQTGLGRTNGNNPSMVHGAGKTTTEPNHNSLVQQLANIEDNARANVSHTGSQMEPSSAGGTLESPRTPAAVNPASADPYRLLPGQETPMNVNKAANVFQTPKPRDVRPDIAFETPVMAQNVAAASITPGPDTALKNKSSLGQVAATPMADRMSEHDLMDMDQHETNDNSSVNSSNERIIPAGNVNNEKKFEESHEEYQRILRDLGDVLESGDKEILDLDVRLVTAHAEAVQDQGDLLTLLGSLEQASAEMDAMNREYEEYAEQMDGELVHDMEDRAIELD